jgi:hypothetical protein
VELPGKETGIMENEEKGKSPFTSFHHVGAIVSDCDKAAELLESLGMGKFEPVVIAAKERTLYGKPIGAYKLKVRQAHVGPIRFELIEPIEGKEHICKDVKEQKGEGLYHIAFVVDDVDKEAEWLTERGVDVIFRSKYVDGGGMAYFDTDKIGGMLLELIQRPDDYVPRDKRTE